MEGRETFERVCSRLEEASGFDRLEARGTVRIVLKKAGLEPSSVTPHQMRVAAEKVLPTELAARGIDDAESLCRRIIADLDAAGPAAADESSPEAVFARLGGRS